MNTLPVYEADQLHQVAAAKDIRYQDVDHPLFERFSRLARRFRRELRDAEVLDDEQWTDFLWTLQRYRVDHSTAPLPFDDPTIATRLSSRDLASLTTQTRAAFPEFAARVVELVELLEELRSSPDNPLMDQLGALAADSRGLKALFVRDSRLLSRVEAATQRRFGLGRVEPVGTAELRSTQVYDNLFIFGPVRWCPDFIFSAPRARVLQVLSFRWQRERWRPQPAFRGTTPSGSPTNGHDPVPQDEREDPLPEIDWSSIERGASRTLATEDDSDPNDMVSARLVLLDGGYGVFLDADEGSTVLTMDVKAADASRVERIPTHAIEPEMFVLLRTEGGGDYIVPLADQILGQEAEPLRIAQKLWKSLLRQHAQAKGLLSVSFDLIDHGSERADEQNVRNWMSLGSIRPQDRADFDAIMALVGLGNDADRYWKMMGRIRAAHRAAGHEIRRRLLEQVRVSGIGEFGKGRVDFELPGVDGGCLTAFRVEDAAPTPRRVSGSQLGRPFVIEG